MVHLVVVEKKKLNILSMVQNSEMALCLVARLAPPDLE